MDRVVAPSTPEKYCVGAGGAARLQGSGSPRTPTRPGCETLQKAGLWAWGESAGLVQPPSPGALMSHTGWE